MRTFLTVFRTSSRNCSGARGPRFSRPCAQSIEVAHETVADAHHSPAGRSRVRIRIPLPQGTGSPEPVHSGRFASIQGTKAHALARHPDELSLVAAFVPALGPSTTWVPPDEPRLPCRAKPVSALCALPCPVRPFERSIANLPVRPTCGTLPLCSNLGVSLPVVPKHHFGNCRASRVSARRRTHGHVGRGCDPSGVVAGRHGSPWAWSRSAPSSPFRCQRPTELSVAGPLADGSGASRFRGAEPRSAPLPSNNSRSRCGSVSMRPYSQALRSHPRAFHG